MLLNIAQSYFIIPQKNPIYFGVPADFASYFSGNNKGFFGSRHDLWAQCTATSSKKLRARERKWNRNNVRNVQLRQGLAEWDTAFWLAIVGKPTRGVALRRTTFHNSLLLFNLLYCFADKPEIFL